MLKSGLRFWTAGIALVLVGGLASCAVVGEIFPPSVPVYIGGDFRSPVFDPDTVTVQPGNRIVWSNSTDATVTLQFPGVPVGQREIVIAPGRNGTVRVNDPAAVGVYKYNALFRREGETNPVDPYIDVEPKNPRR